MDMYKRIKKRREELGLTQEELGVKLGYTSRSSIAKIEAGKIDIPQSKIVAFAKALKTTPSYLMGWEEDNGKPLTNSEKSADPISQLSKKEKFEYDKFMESATYFFNDETVSDEDKKKFSDALQNAFVTALMQKNKKKKK